MIEIKKKGTKVELSLTVFIPYDSTRIFSFDWECGSVWAAGLLTRHFQTALGDAIKRTREREYLRGWKDAKAHNRKKDWFSYKLE